MVLNFQAGNYCTNNRLPPHWQKPIAMFHSIRLFTGDDSLAGANFSASATLDAGVGINYIDVTLRNRFNGAVGKTCAASYTFVSNYVSHNCVFFENVTQKMVFPAAKIIN